MERHDVAENGIGSGRGRKGNEYISREHLIV